MTETQRQLVAHAIMLAQSAAHDLVNEARPTSLALNRTIERLASIEISLKAVMA